MNKQDKGNGRRGIEWTDYTWNPVGGCQYACRWHLPDDSSVECYAATKVNWLRHAKFYPQGFEHHYWHPERLEEPLHRRKPAKIFLDSMTDLMGVWIPDAQVEAVLDVCRRASWHTFQLLTKNAPRLLRTEFPPNVWVGISVPPAVLQGQALTPAQQVAMLKHALDILDTVDVPVRWMSIEPLVHDLAPVLRGHHLQWAVIGPASSGSQLYQPDPHWIANCLHELDHMRAAVFLKGNLTWTPRREEFPLIEHEAQQMALF